MVSARVRYRRRHHCCADCFPHTCPQSVERYVDASARMRHHAWDRWRVGRAVLVTMGAPRQAFTTGRNAPRPPGPGDSRQWWCRRECGYVSESFGDEAPDLAAVWSRSLAALTSQDIAPNHRAFVRLTRPLALVEDTVLLAAPDDFARRPGAASSPPGDRCALARTRPSHPDRRHCCRGHVGGPGSCWRFTSRQGTGRRLGPVLPSGAEPCGRGWWSRAWRYDRAPRRTRAGSRHR